MTDEQGNTYRLKRILLSPLGIHIDFTAPNPHLGGVSNEPILTGFKVSLMLKDGTVVPMKDANKGFHGSLDTPRGKADYGAMFDQPIPLERIEAVSICGTAAPVYANEAP